MSGRGPTMALEPTPRSGSTRAEPSNRPLRNRLHTGAMRNVEGNRSLTVWIAVVPARPARRRGAHARLAGVVPARAHLRRDAAAGADHAEARVRRLPLRPLLPRGSGLPRGRAAAARAAPAPAA